jgi:hypothetical protein
VFEVFLVLVKLVKADLAICMVGMLEDDENGDVSIMDGGILEFVV